VAAKIAQIDKREKELEEREKKVAQILEIQDKKSKGFVKLRVGNELFISKVSILTSVKDSFFHGLLSHETERINEDEYYIPRDNVSFRYVLEFLTYGKLLSQISDKGVLQKLVADADYYILEQLKQNALEQLKQNELEQSKRNALEQSKLSELELLKNLPKLISSTKIIGKWCANAAPSNGGYWNWNIVEIAPPSSHFTLSSGHTITFNVTGLYQISVATSLINTSNGSYMSLYRNGSPVTNSYRADANGYYNSWYLNEILNINASDYIQIYQGHSGSIIGGQISNKLTILML